MKFLVPSLKNSKISGDNLKSLKIKQKNLLTVVSYDVVNSKAQGNSLWSKRYKNKLLWHFTAIREKCTKLACQNIFPDFSWKVTIRHYYHKMYCIHYLKMFCNCCHINKLCILAIPNMFPTCQTETIEKSVLTIP